MSGPPGAWPAVEHLVPHRGGILLLRRVVDWDGERLTAIGRIPADCPLAGAGGQDGEPRATAVLGLEMAAQAAAALEALEARRAGGSAGPRIGYLVGLRQGTLARSHLPVDRDLHVAVHPAGGAGPLRRFEIRVSEAAGATPIVTAVLSTYSTT